MAADRSLQLSIRGSKALRLALRAAEDMASLQELREAYAEVGGIITQRAHQIANSQGKAAQKAADTLKLNRALTNVSITLGGAGDGVSLGQEFGANHDKPRVGKGGWTSKSGSVGKGGRKFKGYNQFPLPAKKNPGTGFLYPAIHAESDNVLAAYTAALDRIIERITAEGPDE